MNEEFCFYFVGRSDGKDSEEKLQERRGRGILLRKYFAPRSDVKLALKESRKSFLICGVAIMSIRFEEVSQL